MLQQMMLPQMDIIWKNKNELGLYHITCTKFKLKLTIDWDVKHKSMTSLLII